MIGAARYMVIIYGHPRLKMALKVLKTHSRRWEGAHPGGSLACTGVHRYLISFVYNVGCKMAMACQPFVSPHLKDTAKSLPALLSQSQTLKARLLHYFPPSSRSASVVGDGGDVIDSWCGFHKDHSILTGLCSAMYMAHSSDVNSPKVSQAQDPTSGLYIRTRGGDLRKVTIPTDCLAFQTGEALEVATEGRLRATPHCVRAGTGGLAISRESFALFMATDTEHALSPSETYGQFSKRIIKSHYGTDVLSVD